MAYQEFEEGRSESKPKWKSGERAWSFNACRRWNAGVCPSSDGKCRYKHVCSGCKEDTLSPLAPEESDEKEGVWRGGEDLRGGTKVATGGGDVGFAPRYKRGFVSWHRIPEESGCWVHGIRVAGATAS